MKYPISGTNVKDVALILLSVGALISGFVLHKSNRTEQWISDLRSEVAAFMGFIALAHTPIQEVKDGCERNLALIYLYLDAEKPLHNKLYNDLKTLLDLHVSFEQRVRNKNYTSDKDKLIMNIYSTAKEIIKKKRPFWVP